MLKDVESEETFKEPGLKEIFGRILTTERFSDPVNAVVDLIYTDELDAKGLAEILSEYRIKDIIKLKNELLDLLIVYVKIILKDLAITEREHRDMVMLKRFFKIREGDFYNYRHKVIKSLIISQLRIIYNDGNIDHKEAMHKVNLQGLFDLSYDQFLEFAEAEILDALNSGANIVELDTVRYPKGFNN